ncbi:unnamed protein product [Microthlaspi erraticum]|uniref:Uncharacterized protein n=1 Tax=Microthlaspi erraticum TaxID=1685480 RepID=A0A6D2IUC4_9BRAS|nr:unnamed protein product [Microthlaspi erraticum]
MFLSTNSTSSKIQGLSCVIMWVLGLHKVHGEESIVVLLVHGELILLLLFLSLFHWLILVPLLIIFINQLVHLFSFLFTLSLITPSSFGEPFPPLEQGSLQSQTPLAHSHY